MTATKLIAILTGGLTLLLALFSFVLSFNALTDLAANHGISIPILFPLTVEAAVVVFSLNALYRSLHGESAKVQWALIIGASLLAGAFNVLHAEQTPLSRTMAAMPSLFLLLSFETFLGQIRHTVTRNTAIRNLADLVTEAQRIRSEAEALAATKAELAEAIAATEAQLEAAKTQAEAQAREQKAQLEAQLLDLQGAIEAAKAELESARKQAKTGVIEPDDKLVQAYQIDGWLAAGGTQIAVAERLGLSDATVRNRLRMLNGSRISEVTK